MKKTYLVWLLHELNYILNIVIFKAKQDKLLLLKRLLDLP